VLALCDEADVDPAALTFRTSASAAQGRGFVRPEVAVMLGLAKLVTRNALALDAMVDAAYLAPLFAGYFPPAFREAWPDALREHRLRREITALVVTNRLIDAGAPRSCRRSWRSWASRFRRSRWRC
jgi:glutamate dehydrogenase